MVKELYKDVTIGNRKWRVGRFDALTGAYVAYKLLTQILPMGLEGKIPGLTEQSEARENLPQMTKADFTSLMKDCLRVCSELKMLNNVIAPVGVLMSDGRWAVADLEHDTLTVMLLTIHTLGFNISDFFSEDTLEDVKNSISMLNLSNVSA
jgi:hypothetical protein